MDIKAGHVTLGRVKPEEVDVYGSGKVVILMLGQNFYLTFQNLEDYQSFRDVARGLPLMPKEMD